MLKSYKQLDRWFGALEPDSDPSSDQRTDRRPESEPTESDGIAQYPDYIPPAGDRDDTDRYADPAPAEMSKRRSGFTGGWSDWVAEQPTAPDDDVSAPEGELVHFPWPGDESPEQPARIGRRHGRLQEPDRAAGGNARRSIIAVLVAVVLLTAAALVVLYLLGGLSGQSKADTADGGDLKLTADGADSMSAAEGRCPTENNGPIVGGAGPGSTNSGPEAIMRFQHAYYVQRSADEAREVVAPGAAVSPAGVIQQGIDSIDAGTEHCVGITTIDDGRYSVEITEYRSGGDPDTYSRQTVTTEVIDGRTLITGITAG